MKTQVITCDLCKQSKAKEDIVEIMIRTQGQLRLMQGSCIVWELTKDVCRDCITKKGFHIEPSDKKEEQQE